MRQKHTKGIYAQITTKTKRKVTHNQLLHRDTFINKHTNTKQNLIKSLICLTLSAIPIYRFVSVYRQSTFRANNQKGIRMKIISLVLLLGVSISNLNGASYVTYEPTNGRLGDNLLGYVHAKWLAYKHDITLLYRPFPYSDKLMLSKDEMHYKDGLCAHFIRPVFGDNPNYLADDTLFTIPIFAHALIDKTDGSTSNLYRFDPDYQDQQFKEQLQKMIKPIQNLTLITPPKGRTSVALHVRKNSGGFDWEISTEVIERLGYLPAGTYLDLLYPLKCPSDEYYIEQVHTISKLLDHIPLYIYIFTDDPNPQRIAEKLQARCANLKNIEFDYRKTVNHHQANVLEDLFSLLNFDMLIRADSSFSIIAEMIGTFKMVISPENYQKIGDTIVINKVAIQKSVL